MVEYLGQRWRDILGGVVLAVLSARTVLWLKRISLMRPPEFERLLGRVKLAGWALVGFSTAWFLTLTVLRLLADGGLDAPVSAWPGPMQSALVLCTVVRFFGYLTLASVIVAKALRWLAEELHGRWVNETLPHDCGDPKESWRRVKAP